MAKVNLPVLLALYVTANLVTAHTELRKIEVTSLGTNVSINCSEHEVMAVHHWMLPHNLLMVQGGYEDEHIWVRSL